MIVSRKNIIRIFTLVVAAVLVFAGCGAGNQTAQKLGKYESPGASEDINGIVAENNKYQLLWDDAKKKVSVYDKSDGSVFSTTRHEESTELDAFGLPKPQDSRMVSDIIVEYTDPSESNTNNVLYSSVDAVDWGNVTCEAIDNGIRVTFYFETAQISVPVDYVLTEEGFSVSVDPTKIKETEYKTVSVGIVPFACSCKNDAEDAYLFVPSGSGALIYPNNISTGGGVYSQVVYGSDPLEAVWEKDFNEQNIKLPVYGVKDGNNALFAIVSSGDDSVSIESVYGSSTLGASTVYSTFNIRGKVEIRKKLYGSRTFQIVQYSDDVIETPCKVDFYILKGNEANYSGMAKVFRGKALNEIEATKNSEMNLVIYGGAMVDKSFLGVPYRSVFAATTVEEAYKMVKELKEETGASLSVMLKGFGKSGVDIGEIGGDYKLSGALGSKSDLNDLGAYCKENDIGIYFDFDVIRQSASGFFSSGNAAKAIDQQTEYQYLFDKAVNSRITDTKYSLISRSSLTAAADKIISKTAKWGIDGVALDTLSNISYSDYGAPNYHARNQMSSDVKGIFAALKDSGKNVASVSANYYAANSSDIIFETPSTSNKSDAFSVDVPFYQMVFKGKVNIGCESVNLTFDERDAVLKSVESGAGITYALYNNYDTSLTDSYNPIFATGTYDLIKQGIVDEVKALKGYYDSIEDTSVREHILISNDVRKTVFENGTVAYVNYSDNDYTGDFGTVAAHGYLTVPAAAE